MRNKTISITEEIYEQLKEEDNASNLIVSLLEKHYNNIKPKEIEPEKDVFSQLEDNNVIINNDLATNKLREEILKEMSEQESIEEVFNEN